MLRLLHFLALLSLSLLTCRESDATDGIKIYMAQVIHANTESEKAEKLLNEGFQSSSVVVRVLQSKPALHWKTTTLYRREDEFDVKYAVVLPNHENSLLVLDTNHQSLHIVDSPLLAISDLRHSRHYRLGDHHFAITRQVFASCDKGSLDYPLRIIEKVSVASQSYEIANGFTDEIETSVHPETGAPLTCDAFKLYYENKPVFANVILVADLNGDHLPDFVTRQTQKYCHELKLFLSQPREDAWQPVLVASDDLCTD